MSTARRIVAGSAALLCAGFAALGVWQVQRLQWKTSLIAQVDQRVTAPAVAAPAWNAVSKDADEYRHLRLQGRFMDQGGTLVQAATALGSGYWVLTPFCGTDGRITLVNRGFLAPDAARRLPPPSTPPVCTPGAGGTSIEGLLRMSEPGGGFLRNNDPAQGRWYSRDVAAIAAARGLGRVAPYFVDQAAAAPDPESASLPTPVGGLTVISFNNHHLVYALTWFALALMAGGAGVFVARAPARPDGNALG